MDSIKEVPLLRSPFNMELAAFVTLECIYVLRVDPLKLQVLPYCGMVDHVLSILFYPILHTFLVA